MPSVRDGKIYVWRWEERRKRRWLHLCCVNEGEQDWKKVRGRERQRVFVSFITQQQFCFRGHLKLTACLISSGDSLQSVCAHVCMLCVYVYMFVNAGVYGKGGECKEIIPDQSGLTIPTNHFVASIAAPKYHLGLHASPRNACIASSDAHTHIKTCTYARGEAVSCDG